MPHSTLGLSLTRNGTLVADLFSFTPSPFFRNVRSDQRHVEAAPRVKMGIQRYGPCQFSLPAPAFYPFITALTTNSFDAYILTFADGTTFTFSAHVINIRFAPVPADAVQSAEITLQPHGLLLVNELIFGLPSIAEPPEPTESTLLLEDGSILLLEDGTSILLET